ncbi:hypothetical protein OROHE_011710 [Orobanche hederae]
MPSQEILKIRDGTPLEAEGILTYIKKPSQEILKIHDGTPLEKKIVARILVFKIRPSQDILKIRDGTPLEAEGILTYRKSPRNCSVWHFSSKLDVPSNVVQKKRVSRILVFKIRPSQEILKIRDGTPLEAEGILTYRKRPSQEILKIHDVQKKIVARILVFKIRPSQDILKIRDGTPLEAEGILTYRKSPRNCSVWDFSSKLDVPSNVVQKKRVSRILVFKIRPSQEILKIRDGTPLEAEGILTYRKRPSKLIVQKKRVAGILVFKIRPSQEILKIRDGTPLEKRVAGILVFKIRPSQEILKIRDGTPLEWPSQDILKIRDEILKIRDEPSQDILKIRDEILKIRDGSTPLEAEGILTYRKRPSQEILKIRDVARILVFKISPSQEILKIRDVTPLEAEGILTFRKKALETDRPSQEILKILDGTPLEKKIVARTLVFKIRPCQDILKIRDGTPLEAEGILTYRKSPRNCSVWHFSSKLDVPSNVVQKKRVSRILVFKIRPSQEILKIRDGTPLEAEGILTYRKRPSKLNEILKIRDEPSQEILKIRDEPSQDILKIRDGTPLEWPSQEILKIRDDKLAVPSNVVQKKIVARILVFKIRPSQDILKIHDGTPLEAEGILTYRKSPRNCSVWHFSSKLDIPNNIVQKKRVSRILVFKIRPSQEILKIRDGSTPLEAEGILTYRKRPSKLIVLALF